jgi:hypothetical protein
LILGLILGLILVLALITRRDRLLTLLVGYLAGIWLDSGSGNRRLPGWHGRGSVHCLLTILFILTTATCKCQKQQSDTR